MIRSRRQLDGGTETPGDRAFYLFEPEESGEQDVPKSTSRILPAQCRQVDEVEAIAEKRGVSIARNAIGLHLFRQ